MDVSTMSEAFNEGVKRVALKLYREKGIKTSCERCYYITDPICPDFPHICMLEEALNKPGESRDWALENLAHCIEMRKAHMQLYPF